MTGTQLHDRPPRARLAEVDTTVPGPTWHALLEADPDAMPTQSPEHPRRPAPILQLIPAGTILTSGFLDKLHDSHGLLPTRIEYPRPRRAANAGSSASLSPQ